MTTIHPAAIVDSAAKLGANVEIGPFCVIGPHVDLGDNVRLHSHVVIAGRTTLGAGCEVYPFASLGQPPQDKKFTGEHSRLVIGERNIIREHATMSPGTEGGGLITKIGSDGLFMIGCHIAHDCQIGSHVVFSNNASLAGHCVVGDHVILGGFAGVHQFVRIGAHAFVGGLSAIVDDIIPFGMAVGDRAGLCGLNLIGLKRRGFSRGQIQDLRKAYRLLFSTEGTFAERLDGVDEMFGDNDGVRQILDFVKADSGRPLCVPHNAAPSA
jgi:UDP-N-acetylglucosamine acyltransferase